MKVKRFHVNMAGERDFIYVNAKIFNPDQPDRSKKINFLIDTGAAGCAIPKSLADELNLKEKGVVDVGLADGRSVKASAAYVLIEIGGKKVYTWTIIGEGFEPILGIDVMKVLKIHVDVPDRAPLIPLRSFKVNSITMKNNFKLNPEGEGEREIQNG